MLCLPKTFILGSWAEGRRIWEVGGHRNVNPQPQTLRYAQGDYIGETFEAKLGADRWDDLTEPGR